MQYAGVLGGTAVLLSMHDASDARRLARMCSAALSMLSFGDTCASQDDLEIFSRVWLFLEVGFTRKTLL